jgi:hypothetical protein
VGAQKEIFSHILRDAGVDPSEISYVEMHGTGTQVGILFHTLSNLEFHIPSTSIRRYDILI